MELYDPTADQQAAALTVVQVILRQSLSGGYRANGFTWRNRSTENNGSAFPPLLRFSVVIPLPPSSPFSALPRGHRARSHVATYDLPALHQHGFRRPCNGRPPPYGLLRLSHRPGH